MPKLKLGPPKQASEEILDDHVIGPDEPASGCEAEQEVDVELDEGVRLRPTQVQNSSMDPELREDDESVPDRFRVLRRAS